MTATLKTSRKLSGKNLKESPLLVKFRAFIAASLKKGYHPGLFRKSFEFFENSCFFSINYSAFKNTEANLL